MILKGISIAHKPRKTKGYNGSQSPIYQTKAWKIDRTNHIKANPFCKLCLELDNKYIEATVSDHITPINKGGSIWDWNNRQALCKRHNAMKTALDNPNNV